MKRFKITNIQNGLKFQIEADQLGALQPEWGANPEIVEEDITVELILRLQEQQARKYLAETDWYIIREMDSGVACPQEIKDARALARTKV